MDEIKINVYAFAELKPEAQKIAIEQYREGQDVRLDFYNDDAQEAIKAAGFIEQSGDGKPEFNYSLGYSQGDGASFTVKSLSLRAFCKAHRLSNKYRRLLNAEDRGEASAKISRESCHYYHERSARAWVSVGYYTGAALTEIQKEADALEAEIEEARLELCRRLTREGYDEIESQQTDGYIKDSIEGSDYRFLKFGERFVYA